MFGWIISGISKRNKINDLNNLKDRGYLSFDEYSIMKDLAIYGDEAAYPKFGGFPKNPLYNKEYFNRGTDTELKSSLKDFWEGKTDSKDFFAEKYKGGIFSTVRFAKSRSSVRPEGSSDIEEPLFRKKDSSVRPEGSSDIEEPHTTISGKTKKDRWGFVITDQFMSSINKIDRKLQGRILLAITEIITHPTTSKGDTAKPLSADKKGYWRYRIGDYRLIYKPVESLQEILLISFAARGSAY